MQGAGSALMGIGSARGEDRAVEAAEAAISSPLLEASIDGAHGVLFSIQGGSDLGLFEAHEAARLVQEAAHPEANVIFGTVIDDALGDEVRVTVIAAGFDEGEGPTGAQSTVGRRPIAPVRSVPAQSQPAQVPAGNGGAAQGGAQAESAPSPARPSFDRPDAGQGAPAQQTAPAVQAPAPVAQQDAPAHAGAYGNGVAGNQPGYGNQAADDGRRTPGTGARVPRVFPETEAGEDDLDIPDFLK
jgi:cell division protein FtsZ